MEGRKNYNDYLKDKANPCYDLLNGRLRALYEGKVSADFAVSCFEGDDLEFFAAIIPLVKDIEAAINRKLAGGAN